MGNERTAHELYTSCSNYFDWVNKDYKIPVDQKTLFNMGKCQGIIETLGRTMLTLCYEKKRNMSINSKLTANLKGIKTIDIVKKFVKKAYNDGGLRSISSHSYLLDFISKTWPCK